MTVPAKFNDELLRLTVPEHKDLWYCMHGHIHSRHSSLGRPEICPACEDIEHLRRHRKNLISTASVVLDQIDSAGNVPLMAAFDGRELKNLRDAIAEARKDSSWTKL